MVFVADAKPLAQQKGEVVTLGIAAQLRRVAQPYVNDCIHASLAQQGNESGQWLALKTNGVDGRQAVPPLKMRLDEVSVFRIPV
jgi:hypothetical protein